MQAGSPLFAFSSKKDVVVKVQFSLADSNGTRRSGTKYYLFRHGSLGNAWRYRKDTTAYRYYSNFF